MAKKAVKREYEITFEGDYFAAAKGGLELRPYNVTLTMNEEHRQAGFLSVFKNVAAPALMRKKYPDYADALATHRVVAIKDLAQPDLVIDDPKLMTFAEVIAFVSKNALPVNLTLYKDEDELKQAVVECLEDEDAFVEAQSKRQEVKGPTAAMAASLASLNPELGGGFEAAQKEAATLDLDTIPDSDGIQSAPQPLKRSEVGDEDSEVDLTTSTKSKKNAKETDTTIDDL